MPHPVLIRPIRQDDFAAWKPLWDGYNAFYGRSGATALPTKVTEATWQRFFDPAEPVFALVAEALSLPSEHDEDRAHLLPTGPLYCSERAGGDTSEARPA